MRNVPSLPPPTTVPEETPGVKPLGQGRAVRRVTEPSAPPRVVTRYGTSPARETPVEAVAEHPIKEQRHGEDRRKICRRTYKKTTLPMDTRATLERRHRNRRQEDIKTNVEEEV